MTKTTTAKTAAPKKTRGFSKIQNATITFNESVVGDFARNRVRYKKSVGATVVIGNADPIVRTVMGFGAALNGLPRLQKGRTVEVAVQREGGTIRLVGPARPTRARKAA